MEPIPASSERCVRRSRVRARVLIALASLGEAYASQLARAAGVEAKRLRAALYGSEDYRADLALVPLGLVTEDSTPQGRVYRVSTRGLRKARSLVKQWRRFTGRTL